MEVVSTLKFAPDVSQIWVISSLYSTFKAVNLSDGFILHHVVRPVRHRAKCGASEFSLTVTFVIWLDLLGNFAWGHEVIAVLEAGLNHRSPEFEDTGGSVLAFTQGFVIHRESGYLTRLVSQPVSKGDWRQGVFLPGRIRTSNGQVIRQGWISEDRRRFEDLRSTEDFVVPIAVKDSWVAVGENTPES